MTYAKLCLNLCNYIITAFTSVTTMSLSTTSAIVNAERFLADRAAPICGLDAGKSFEQLRSRFMHTCSTKHRW